MKRSEFPNPQWERKNWLCLNGEWEFDFDFGKSAIERKLYESESLDKRIIVPFCPESSLSGVGYTDFMPAVVYRKTVVLDKNQLAGRVILHFGAVDFYTVVYVNGREVCRHKGGYTPFEADITDAAVEGENSVFVYAEDDVRSGKQCGGKQSTRYESYHCSLLVQQVSGRVYGWSLCLRTEFFQLNSIPILSRGHLLLSAKQREQEM